MHIFIAALLAFQGIEAVKAQNGDAFAKRSIVQYISKDSRGKYERQVRSLPEYKEQPPAWYLDQSKAYKDIKGRPNVFRQFWGKGIDEWQELDDAIKGRSGNAGIAGLREFHPLRIYQVDLVPNKFYPGSSHLLTNSYAMDSGVGANWDAYTVIGHDGLLRISSGGHRTFEILEFSIFSGGRWGYASEFASMHVEVDCNRGRKYFKLPKFDAADGNLRSMITFKDVNMESSVSTTEQNWFGPENFCVFSLREEDGSYVKDTLKIGMLTIQLY